MIKLIIFTPYVIRLFTSGRIKCEENVACVRDRNENCMQCYWVRETEVERPLGRPRHRWVGNIKMTFF
jgi:hypothetical protein